MISISGDVTIMLMELQERERERETSEIQTAVKQKQGLYAISPTVIHANSQTIIDTGL